jgi:hypothetical protein
MDNLFKRLATDLRQLEALGRTPVAISMAWSHFEGPEVEAAFIEYGWEADYCRCKLNPAQPFSILSLPVCFNYAKGLNLTVAVASVPRP